MVADCKMKDTQKMKDTHKKNQRFANQHGDLEERVARRKCRYQEKQDNKELFTESPKGRNPACLSRWNDWDNDCDLHIFEDTYDTGPVTIDKDVTEITGTSSYSQLLQIRNKINTMKCPPIIASDKMPRYQWEDKPMLVMKSTKRKMSRRNKDAPQDVSPLRSTSQEKEVPPDSGLVQDRHQSEDREPDTAKLSKNDEGYKEKVQLEEEIQEVGTKKASYKTSVVQLEDKKTDQTEQMQSSTTENEDLVQQLQKIRDIEQKLETQHQQLLQQMSQLEDICG